MKRLFVLVAMALAFSTAVLAQSIPSATISGKVTADGAALPGVTVTVTSPNLQGTRSTVTSDAGDYILPLLPPGNYTATFELSGMQTITRKLVLTAARTDRVEIAMRPAAVSEAITVTAETPMTAAVESTQVSTNFKQEFVEQLPVDRSLRGITLLTPGVNDNGPVRENGRNIMISGAMSYDSLYLVNGAIVNENLRGQAHTLFIEDAIQETTVLTGGISAEYGHFTGGVVNAITKSGGNELKGSFRSNLTNESWSARTPLTIDQAEKVNPVYEATLGGPFLRDRLWFFGAGRLADTSDVRQTQPGAARLGDQDANGVQIPVGTLLTPIAYPHTLDETRVEGKLTGSLTSKHTLVASYLDIKLTETNQTAQTVMDLDSLVGERGEPTSMAVVNYNGVLTNRFFVEAQYSKKKKKFVGSGSPYFDLIKGTLIADRARGTRYWSPTFRATPEGEARDIEDYTAKGTYFLSTPRIGSHELRLGYEDFNEVRDVNNYQNGSDYRISLSSTIVRGNQVFPIVGNTGTLTRVEWRPIFVLSQGSDYTTRSGYINDRWNLNNHWTFNLGLRYDKHDDLSGAHTFKIADSSALNPRVAAHYDIFGNGRIIVNASYGQYSGRLSEGAANDADPAGRTALLSWDYRGPAVNTSVNTPTSSLIPTDKAIQTILDWFFANGGTNRRPFRTTPSVPGIDSKIDLEGLESPLVTEWTVGAGTTIGTRGYARADVVHRVWGNFYTSFRDTVTGKTTDPLTNAQFDLAILRSDDDVYNREYDAVQTQFSYRLMDKLNLGGTYTWSHLTGNVTGEDAGSGPLVGDDAAEYPEYRRQSWNTPTGRLAQDQKHRARLWASYDLLTPVGSFNFSLLENFDSGRPFSVTGAVDTRPYVTNPGYLTPPASVTYFLGGRGSQKLEDITRTDLAINYKVKLLRGIELFVQPEVINLFNEQAVESVNTEVLTAVQCASPSSLASGCPGPLNRFNPFTEEPVEGVNYVKGARFGKPTEEADYQTARTFRVSLGIRF